MPILLQVQRVDKAYGTTVLLRDATAGFGHDQKIGMIGRNGAGKSTLCRILAGQEAADAGTITRHGDLRLAYLEQHDAFGPGESVRDFLVRTTGAEAWRCAEMAARYRITNEMMASPVRGLPGGYQTRVKLTAMLLGGPNFLLLDEPSNYLDLATLILLENYLLDFRGGYLVVSHDREFLKRTCDHTLELEDGELTLYPGDVEEYFEFKELQRRQTEAYNRGVEKKRAQLQLFVDRFRAKASIASRAQSKLKQMQRLKTIEIGHPAGRVRIRIPRVESRTGTALDTRDLAIGYPDKVVASGIDMDIPRGRHVAILGDNGAGKTTFLRTIAGSLSAKQGSFRWASGLSVSYYAQHVFSTLDPADTVTDHLARASSRDVSRQEVLDLAGAFLFSGDAARKPVKVLSGGERARLVLAGLLLSRRPVLLFDEPTNHLDFETVEALGRALREYQGTVFFISHDRTFVNLVADYILEVKDGAIRRYPGSYEDYVDRLERMAREEELDPKPPRPEPPKPVLDRNLQEAKNRRKKEIAFAKRSLGIVEKRLEEMAGERNRLLAEMEKNPLDISREQNKRLKELQDRMVAAEEEWCGWQAQLEELPRDGITAGENP